MKKTLSKVPAETSKKYSGSRFFGKRRYDNSSGFAVSRIIPSINLFAPRLFSARGPVAKQRSYPWNDYCYYNNNNNSRSQTSLVPITIIVCVLSEAASREQDLRAFASKINSSNHNNNENNGPTLWFFVWIYIWGFLLTARYETTTIINLLTNK